MKVRVHITVRGAVQGVGFRPFVYRLASHLHLTGWVENSVHGVRIEAEGNQTDVDVFLRSIPAGKPPRAVIQGIESMYRDPAGYTDFTIRESANEGSPTTIILPDIATCPECLAEILDPANRRFRYPFTNCTHCGPRFTIVESLPYDRPNTTMKTFRMCPECLREYEDPGDRRFHAQPIACPACGPQLAFWNPDGTEISRRGEALAEAVGLVRTGGVLALKGLGGFHFIVDATNEAAVNSLRRRKRRGAKPFALMVAGAAEVHHLCEVEEIEERSLASPESPIVVLRRKKNASPLAASVAPGNPTLGVMLPYTPLHHLLLRDLSVPIVATSGNLSDEPICTDEHDALARLKGIADGFLVHDRPIVRHADDSIIKIVMGREMVLRRARGYAPFPLPIDRAAGVGEFLAVGAHLKNTVSLSRGSDLFVSQHIGDLETPESLIAFRRTVTDLQSMLQVKPETVVSDMHPDYLSSGYARSAGAPLLSIQHHAAHVASCMADNGLSGTVLGFAWDGTGYGPDGMVWGGEAFLTDGGKWNRIASFFPFRLPGGETAVREPRRTAIGMLAALHGPESLRAPELPFVTDFTFAERLTLAKMIEQRINAPATSSVGRLFDGIAAITGICQRADYEGEAAMKLEYAAMDGSDTEPYRFDVADTAVPPGEAVAPRWIIDWRPVMEEVIADHLRRRRANDIAMRFHHTLSAVALAVAERCGEMRIVLSGGCFQNTLLSELLIGKLRAHGFTPYWHQRIPPNDGGISAGQLFAANVVQASEKHRPE
jgi:hydrogenase maturation protein HypF